MPSVYVNKIINTITRKLYSSIQENTTSCKISRFRHMPEVLQDYYLFIVLIKNFRINILFRSTDAVSVNDYSKIWYSYSFIFLKR